jgi:hypothetical protein
VKQTKSGVKCALISLLLGELTVLYFGFVINSVRVPMLFVMMLEKAVRRAWKGEYVVWEYPHGREARDTIYWVICLRGLGEIFTHVIDFGEGRKVEDATGGSMLRSGVACQDPWASGSFGEQRTSSSR